MMYVILLIKGRTKRMYLLNRMNLMSWFSVFFFKVKTKNQFYNKNIFVGCDQDKFSPGCKQYCPTKCKNQRCDAFNGSCIHGCSNPNAFTIDCIGNFFLKLKTTKFKCVKIYIYIWFQLENYIRKKYLKCIMCDHFKPTFFHINLILLGMNPFAAINYRDKWKWNVIVWVWGI